MSAPVDQSDVICATSWICLVIWFATNMLIDAIKNLKVQVYIRTAQRAAEDSPQPTLDQKGSETK